MIKIKTSLQASENKNGITEEEIPPSGQDILEQKILELKEANCRRRDDRTMRKEYADKAYKFAKHTIIGWATFCVIYLIIGFFYPEKMKFISNSVFISITTACTVSILVAFHAVVKGLFLNKE